MLGSIIGDVIGSSFRGAANNPGKFPLYQENSDFTQATVSTIAVMDAIQNDRFAPQCLKDWIGRYPERGYGPALQLWADQPGDEPYLSATEGVAMAIAPVALRAPTLDMALRLAQQLTAAINPAPQSGRSAHTLASAGFLALAGESQESIRRRIAASYGCDLSAPVDALARMPPKARDMDFEISAAIVAALEAKTFEEAIRNAVRIGGDTANLCAMTGGLAECLFGLPDRIYGPALQRLPSEMLRMIDSFYLFCGKHRWPLGPTSRGQSARGGVRVRQWLQGLGRLCKTVSQDGDRARLHS